MEKSTQKGVILIIIGIILIAISHFGWMLFGESIMALIVPLIGAILLIAGILFLVKSI